MEVREAFCGFPKPSIAIDTVILRAKSNSSDEHIAKKNMQVLLVRKSGEKLWHLPGTIMRLGETPRESMSRLVDTSDLYMEQLYTLADNPYRDERGHIISIVYIGIAVNELEFKGDIECAWFDVINRPDRMFRRDSDNECETFEPIGELMYDHKEIIEDTLTRLKGKLMYTDIGFRFVGEEFTLTELENTFCAISEKAISGFRRTMANKVEGTGRMISGKSFRPAELYRKKVKHEV